MEKFNPAQFAQFNAIESRKQVSAALTAFAGDMKPVDPDFAGEVERYRDGDDLSVYHRIADLTDNGDYQRMLLAMVLQSGIDVTTDPAFHYITRQPALSGNTKARHLVLMAMAGQEQGQSA